jgi:hypothetical protein
LIFQHHSDPIPATLAAEIAASPSSRIRLPLLPSHPLVLFTVLLSRPISIQHAYLHTPFHHSSCHMFKTPIPLVIITGLPGLTGLLVHHSIGLSRVLVSLLCIALHPVLYIAGSRGSECPQPEYQLCVILTSLRLQVPLLPPGHLQLLRRTLPPAGLTSIGTEQVKGTAHKLRPSQTPRTPCFYVESLH